MKKKFYLLFFLSIYTRRDTRVYVLLQISETQGVILTILDVQPRESGGGGGKTSDEIVFDLAVSIDERIRNKIDPDKAANSLVHVKKRFQRKRKENKGKTY